MNILGIGVVFTRGRGLDCFESALEEGWREPAKAKSSSINSNFVYGVEPDTLKDKNLLKKIRRSDKFSKMAVLAAADALSDSGADKKHLGVIVGSAFGPHVTTFDFLDGILEYGDGGVSPTKFSNSVHNAAASYIAEVLGIIGPCSTITQFAFSFQYALLTAKLWINDGRCSHVLVGAVEQYGNVLDYIQNYKLTPADDGKIKPFNFNPTCQIPGEGAVFFLVSKEITENVLCEVENISFDKNTISSDLNIIDADGTMSDESAYLSCISQDIPTAAYSPLFGSMMVGSAFNCAAGALMLKNRTYYRNPVTDNPNGINLLKEQKFNAKRISCVRYNCAAENTVVNLIKVP